MKFRGLSCSVHLLDYREIIDRLKVISTKKRERVYSWAIARDLKQPGQNKRNERSLCPGSFFGSSRTTKEMRTKYNQNYNLS